MLERLRKSLETAPVVKFDDYDYFIHPVTDGIPSMDPELLDEVVEAIRHSCDFQCDMIVGAEAMAIPLMVSLSLKTGLPYNIIRKRRYNLPGEVSVMQLTGYSSKELYINGISPGDRVVIVDDVVSTGGTIRALVKAIRSIGAEIIDVLIVLEKANHLEELEEELDIRIKTLVRVEVRNGKVVVLS
jgi:adenine phosphoribosyltransferase